MILPALWAVLSVGVTTFFEVLLAENPFWGPAILIFGALLIVLVSIVPWVRWRSTRFILTNQRAVASTGLIRRSYVEVLHSHCASVQLHQSLGQRVRKSGDVSVSTPMGEQVRFVDVPDAQLVRDAWQQLAYQATEQMMNNDYWAAAQQ